MYYIIKAKPNYSICLKDIGINVVSTRTVNIDKELFDNSELCQKLKDFLIILNDSQEDIKISKNRFVSNDIININKDMLKEYDTCIQVNNDDINEEVYYNNDWHSLSSSGGGSIPSIIDCGTF